MMTHPPNVCPISNKASREMVKKGVSQLPSLSNKYKVKVTQWSHFDPEHLSIMMVEADNPESVRDLLMALFTTKVCNLKEICHIIPVFRKVNWTPSTFALIPFEMH